MREVLVEFSSKDNDELLNSGNFLNTGMKIISIIRRKYPLASLEELDDKTMIIEISDRSWRVVFDKGRIKLLKHGSKKNNQTFKANGALREELESGGKVLIVEPGIVDQLFRYPKRIQLEKMQDILSEYYEECVIEVKSSRLFLITKGVEYRAGINSRGIYLQKTRYGGDF